MKQVRRHHEGVSHGNTNQRDSPVETAKLAFLFQDELERIIVD